MYDNFKLYNYSKSLVSPEGYGRHEANFLSGDIINGFETVIGTGLQVTTKPGNAVIRNGSGGTASAHLVSLTADFTVTLATADASNPRIDAIVLYVDTSVSLPSGTPTAANLDGLGVAKLIKVNGTPAASPSAPSTAAIQSAIGSASYPYTILANWRVNAGVSALSQTNCTDTRVFAAPKNPRALGQNSFIESGGVASFTASTLNGSITAGTAWISVGGVLVPQAFNSLNFTMAASKDRYYYVTLGNSTIQAAADVSNGAASPTLPANSVWIAIAVSGASAITSINQGQIGATAPIVGGRVLMVADSNGQLIFPSPGQRLIGYAQIMSDYSTNNTATTDVPGLVAPVQVPAGRRIKVTIYENAASGNGGLKIGIWEGATQLQTLDIQGTALISGTAIAYLSPSAGLHSYKVAMSQGAGGTMTYRANAAYPASIAVELE